MTTPADTTRKTAAVILGSGITVLGTLRCLREAGVPCYVLDGAGTVVKRSRWYRPGPSPSPSPTPESLRAWLARLPEDRVVLFPCSDEWAVVTAEMMQGGADGTRASICSPEALATFVDKARFADAARAASVPTPWTRTMDTPEDLDEIAEDRFASVFLKPRDSQSFMAAYGVKALRVASRDEARERLPDFDAAGGGCVAQEYIPGPPTDHYFIDGFVDRHGTIRALFARRRLRMYPPPFGNSSLMESVPLAEVEPATESLARLLESLEYRGMFSAEFKKDPRDGVFRLLEVNPRAWWYVAFAADCGVDVCGMAYRDALGHPVETIDAYATGRQCVYPYMDFYAVLAERGRNPIRLAAWAVRCLGSDQPVFRWSDPWPGVRGSLGIVLGRAAKPWR
ncbi:MAG TPA: hypothetical protein VJ925_12205 [Longimicrobiales bacterium]|nr:hypothetical protein [Longimicrobiales bacterium]